jgi:hypothetical protein
MRENYNNTKTNVGQEGVKKAAWRKKNTQS